VRLQIFWNANAAIDQDFAEPGHVNFADGLIVFGKGRERIGGISSAFQQCAKHATVGPEIFKLHIDERLEAIFQVFGGFGQRIFDSRLHLCTGLLIKGEHDRVF